MTWVSPSLTAGLVPQVNRVPDEGKRAPGLAPMLRPEGEKDDAALGHFDFGQRNPILDFLFAEQPA